MTTGLLTAPLRAWVKTTPYDLQKGLLVSAEWNDTLKWWEVTFTAINKTITATTTDWPKFRKGGK